MALHCFLHRGEQFFWISGMAGTGLEAGEHTLLTVRLVMDVLRLIQTVVIKEEGEVFDERDVLLDVFVVFHDTHRDVGLDVHQLGTRRGADNHRCRIACITVGENGIVEVEHTHEESGEHLVMIDGAQRVVHRRDDGCRRGRQVMLAVQGGRGAEDAADDRHHQGGLHIAARHITDTEHIIRAAFTLLPGTSPIQNTIF